MTWQQAQLKYITRFNYGNALPAIDEEKRGSIRVFGSNGPYARYSEANTKAPTIVIGRKGSYGKVNWSDEPVFASDTTFFVDTTTTQHHLRWLFYVLQTLNLDEGSNEAAVPGLNRDNAYQKDVLVPSLPEQRAIAAYLDHATAKLDTLIAVKERLLDLLAEKRQALVSHTVTHGINPDAPLRDSGVEWLGEIPAHWEVIALRRLVTKIEQGWSPQADEREPKKEEWGVLKLNAVKDGKFDETKAKALSESIEIPTSLEVRSGDFLVTRGNTPELVGDVCYVQTTKPRLILSDLIYRLTLNESVIDGKFLNFFLLSPIGRLQIEADARGSSASMVKISQSHILNWLVVCPPLDEQRTIATYIEAKTAKIELLRTASQQTIDLLHERRVALIAAVVSGKIQVTDSYAA